ncbi:transferase family protein [Penicillium riverlandense]|uniref:transferase family protein n=1 Tax=Penicillium riverlandense TaxID=1903569 RepID=UPI00254771A5|nr:transferase family protein [Penicillium riverlandense]KAJ5820637.1 transferase family protein [Penicillium riverlandense]
MTIVTRAYTERVHPRSHGQLSQDAGNTELLSLLDATCVNFSPTSAVWFLEPPRNGKSNTVDLIKHLRDALLSTLEAYPQFCGHLKTVPYRPDEGTSHRQRFGRLCISYGSSRDPGLELVIAESTMSLEDLVPDSKRDVALRDMHQIPFESFVPHTELESPFTPDEDAVNPAVAIQLTKLICGGTVAAIKMVHAFGDAHSMAYFAKDWALVSQAMSKNSLLPSLSPVFQPSLLDKQAAGNIDKPDADDTLLRKAIGLPFHRYDWWTPSECCPWPTEVPEPFKSQPLKPAGNPMPWGQWDVDAPVSHYKIHLSADQIQQIWETASVNGLHRISHHDAVVAHLWSCVNRARNLELNTDDNLVYCNLVYGVRERMSLGKSFIGSPIVMINVAMNVAEACQTDLTYLATAIRSTVTKVRPEDLQNHLHAVAYEDAPQRLWQGFLGEKHIMVTSWVQTPVYAVDFGLGLTPRYVEGVVAAMDGVIQLKQAPPSIKETNLEISEKLKSWYHSGVDISVNLRTDVMEKLIKDPLLFPSKV